MKEINSEEMKKIELDMLVYFDSFCREHNLTYFLAYGTMLGAVRHHGFIPWDDDIDVTMPLEDYYLFIKLFSEKAMGYYRVDSIETNKTYHLPFAKLVDKRTKIFETKSIGYEDAGVFIDIFPISGLSSKYNKAKRISNRCKFLMKYYFVILNKKNFRFGIKKMISYFLSLFLTPRKIAYRLKKLGMKYDYSQSKYVGCVFSFLFIGQKAIYDKQIYSEKEQYVFENNLFFGVKKFDDYLTNEYGDYMSFPPVEKRISNHSFEAFWLIEK